MCSCVVVERRRGRGAGEGEGHLSSSKDEGIDLSAMLKSGFTGELAA